MKVLIVDMTHGGVKIASEFSKLGEYDVYALDIYKTLNEEQKEHLKKNKIKLVEEEFLQDNNDLKVVAPVHCLLDHPIDMTHHEAVAFLMEKKLKLPVIEVTGVKGKTSVIHMLKEIFREFRPLILSSLGVEVLDNHEWKLLKQDISITPASMIIAWELGQEYQPRIFIAETSLGGTGLARVGVITNIAEDYIIASGTIKASQAKAQIFKNKLIACNYSSFHEFYQEYEDKINTFGLTEEANVNATQILYGLQETVFKVDVHGLKTITGETVEEQFKIITFAPAHHHLENVLSAICASLTCGIPSNTIKKGLMNFKGIKGRTSLRYKGKSCIIEEINPGINVTAVKRALNMIEDLPRSAVVFGGKYGVTCEEIEEKSVSEVLDGLDENIELILTDQLGRKIKEKLKRSQAYREDYVQAVEYAIEKQYHNILLIYRSNYPDLSLR
ncbi:MAG: coenzyme F430 synthase [Methanobacterium sp.]|nr:coenzyme F430 synthase [Methanobacterium sp.]